MGSEIDREYFDEVLRARAGDDAFDRASDGFTGCAYHLRCGGRQRTSESYRAVRWGNAFPAGLDAPACRVGLSD